jgi:hypothetical protein
MKIKIFLCAALMLLFCSVSFAQTSDIKLKSCAEGKRVTGCQGNIYRCDYIPKSSPIGTCTYTANQNLCGDRGFSWESCCQIVCADRNKGKDSAAATCAERCSNGQAAQGRFNIDTKGKSR